jgi:hypothetical protein
MSNYEHQTKLAYPDEHGSRIWVKGSERFDDVQLINESGGTIKQVLLAPPFYTYIFHDLVPGQKMSINFSSADGAKYSSSVITKGLDDLENTSEDYSVLFYGCFQPFTIEKNSSPLQSTIYEPKSLPNAFLKAFSKIGTNTDSYTDKPVLPNVKLIIGSGDQVYMDAGYNSTPATRTNQHPLSAWTTTEAQPKLIRKLDYFPEHVALTYRAFGSFNAMSGPLQLAPQVNVWDDHEIRDGWGSQGDEYVNGTLDPKFATIFNSARNGYIDHQFAPGPGRDSKKTNSEELVQLTDNTEPLFQTFTVGDYEGFAFDLRSQRNSNLPEPQVIGDTQKDAFNVWLDKLPKNQKVLIISSMPVFLQNNELLETAGPLYDKELADDIQDGWSQNEQDRKWLIQTLLQARTIKNTMPVFVSGDYHKGAISEIWYGNQEQLACGKSGERSKKIFGYEILASGLYHEGMPRGLKAAAFHRGESQRLGGHFIYNIGVGDNTYCLDPHVEISTVQENFGGLIDSSNPETLDKLTLVSLREDNRVNVFETKLDWEKGFDPDKEKDYIGFWQTLSEIFGFIPLVKDTFTPLGTEVSDYPL